MTGLVVPYRFRGPTSSGNGGWTAGAVAALLDPGHTTAVTVTLRRPPPLDVPLEMAQERTQGETWVAGHDGVPVAEARATGAHPEPPPRVGVEEARAAEAAYPGLTGHPFPECFVCGTARDPGDGLRIFPGPVGEVDGRARAAATWVPDESVAADRWSLRSERSERLEGHGSSDQVSLPVTWAALDCVGAWAADMGERLMVLGRMTARIWDLPRVGEEHVVVGLAGGVEGRKHFTSAMLCTADGRVVGAAEHVWIEVDREAFA